MEPIRTECIPRLGFWSSREGVSHLIKLNRNKAFIYFKASLKVPALFSYGFCHRCSYIILVTFHFPSFGCPGRVNLYIWCSWSFYHLSIITPLTHFLTDFLTYPYALWSECLRPWGWLYLCKCAPSLPSLNFNAHPLDHTQGAAYHWLCDLIMYFM